MSTSENSTFLSYHSSYVADDLRSINCDVTSISGMTKSCFFNLVDTLDYLCLTYTL